MKTQFRRFWNWCLRGYRKVDYWLIPKHKLLASLTCLEKSEKEAYLEKIEKREELGLKNTISNVGYIPQEKVRLYIVDGEVTGMYFPDEPTRKRVERAAV